jgi:hypothetical protein
MKTAHDFVILGLFSELLGFGHYSLFFISKGPSFVELVAANCFLPLDPSLTFCGCKKPWLARL